MTDTEQRALLGISLLAAFADGKKADAEHERLKEIARGFQNPALNGLELYRQVLMRELGLADFTQALTTPESRMLAYEMALGVCESDDLLNDTERTFLNDLKRTLGLDGAPIAPLHQQADALTTSAVPPRLGATPSSAAPASAPGSGTAPVPDAELESTILNQAILAGALELLPHSLASMAIIPLQMRLVYRIGAHYGHTLDRGHIGEMLAAAGIGMTSQVLEGYATKLMKGLLGSVAGGLGRGLAGAFTGSAVSFATTWALGQLAQRYYSGGRSLSALQMRETFQSLMGQARGLQTQYLPEIQSRSRGLNLSDVTRLVSGR